MSKWGKRVRRAIRHSKAAILARSWYEPLDDRYHPKHYGGLGEQEAMTAVRAQLGRLVPSHGQADRIIALEDINDQYLERLRSEADKVCAHHISLFGNSYDLGNIINWHRDPGSNYKWPLVPSYRIDIWNTGETADVRTVWELSCFRHAIVLGQAFWLTREEKYAVEFVSQVNDWCRCNPFNRGANWQCAMMVAIRAVNLFWAYALFADSQSMDTRFHRLMLNLMRLHGELIFHNLENTSSIRGNHYIANLIGLHTLASVQPILTHARVWFDFAMSELKREIGLQVLPDGVSFEASLPYHRLVTEMLLHAILFAATLTPPAWSNAPAKDTRITLSKRSEHILGTNFVNTVEMMLEFVLHYTKPDGSSPQIGDNDGSRWVNFSILQNTNNDHRHLHALAGEIFDREDFRAAGFAAREESIWILGTVPQCHCAIHRTPSSRLFEFAGICIMRNDSKYLITRCSSLGTRGRGTHTHNDNLSFELSVGRHNYIVDPGTFSYLRHPELRNLFRSNAYHNTLRVAGLEQNEVSAKDPFRLFPRSIPSILKWKSDAHEDLFQGQVQMNSPAQDILIHRRDFRLDKLDNRWTLLDAVYGNGFHKLEWFFHVYPGVTVQTNGDEILLQSGPDGKIRLFGDIINKGVVEVCGSWYSSGYDKKEEAQVIHVTRSAWLPMQARLTIEVLDSSA